MIHLDWAEQKDGYILAFDGEKEFILGSPAITSLTENTIEIRSERKVYKADMLIGFWDIVFENLNEYESEEINEDNEDNEIDDNPSALKWAGYFILSFILFSLLNLFNLFLQ